MYKSKDGFTLIELIVVVLIMAIVTGMTLAVFSNFTEDRKLTKEVEKLRDVLELAKKKATDSEIVGDCKKFSGYRVSVGSSSYTLNILCSPVPPTLVSNLVQTFTIGQETTGTSNSLLIQIPGVSDIDFKPLSEGTNITSGSETDFIFKNLIINKCIWLRISSNGVINKDDEVTCP